MTSQITSQPTSPTPARCISAEREPAARRGVVRVRPTTAHPTGQRLSSFEGISRLTAGSGGLSLRVVIVPPGGAAVPHRHRGVETAIYCLQGRVETRFGEGLRESVITEAGDFLYIGPDVPHQPINLSATEPAIAVVARNDADEQEHLDLYPAPGQTADQRTRAP